MASYNFPAALSASAQNPVMGAPATSAIHAKTASIEAAIESAKSKLFDTSSWREFCDVTLTSHGEVQVKGVVLR